MTTEIETCQVVNTENDPEALEAIRKDARAVLERHIQAILDSNGAYIMAYKDNEDNLVGLIGSSVQDATALFAQMLNSLGIMLSKSTGMEASNEEENIVAAMGATCANIAEHELPHLKTKIGTMLMVLGVSLVKNIPPHEIDATGPEALLRSLFGR